MRRNLLNRSVFVMVCVVGLVTTAQSLVIEHSSLENLSTIKTDFSVSEDDVTSFKDVDERRLLQVGEEKLELETGHDIQESLNRSFRTESRLGITKVFHRLRRDTSQVNKIAELAIMYEAVYKELLDSGSWNNGGGMLFNFGFKIKAAMGMPNYSYVDQKCKNILETLKSNLPAAVRHILWADEVYIKNKKYNEYFYAANNLYAIGGKNRKVYTWGVKNSKVGLLDEGQLEFKSQNNAGNSFKIYNPYYDGYLHGCKYYGIVEKKESLRPYYMPCMTFGGGFDNHMVWDTLLVKGNKHIVIKNQYSGYYLFATNDDGNWRRSLILVNSSYYNEAFLWEVEG